MLDLVAPLTLGGGDVSSVCVGAGAPMVLIAGPCVIEGEDETLKAAERIVEIAARVGVSVVFKASFDKANRTSIHSYRGPGMVDGLAVLARVRRAFGVPVTTDVHAPEQAPAVGAVADLLQIPAFLCRQTDLLVACAATGRPVNVKKGQFLAAADMRAVVEKLRSAGARQLLLTERGATFGYQDLVADMRNLVRMRALGLPVCFDATHSVQQPGAGGDVSGGNGELAPYLARGAAGVGIDALFLEVHEDPSRALSDGPNMVPLDRLEALLRQVVAIDAVVRQG